MIIARAAKGAALLLMIFGVVALIGCQGATAGPKGEPGEPGAAGAPGAPGAQGPPGVSPLQTKGTGTLNIVINNTGSDHDELGDLAKPSSGDLDASKLFVYGTAPLKYSVINAPTSGTFKVEIDEASGMISLSKRTASQMAPATADYTTGITFKVRAEDANEVTRDADVTVKANRPPVRCDGTSNLCVQTGQDAGSGNDLPVLPINPHSNHPNFAFIVGTQQELAAVGTITEKPAQNQFWADDRSGATTGSSIGVRGRTAGGDQIAPYFMDDDPDDVKISVTEIDAPGAADDGEHITVSMKDNGDFMVTGLKSTWVEDSCTNSRGDCNQPMGSDPVDAHEPVRVELTATDAGGLTAKTWIYVWVDGAPALATEGGTIRDNYIVKLSDGDTTVLNSVHLFFEDPEGQTMVPVVAANVDTISARIATATITSNALVVTAVNLGETTITVQATAPGYPGPDHGAVAASEVDRDDSGTLTADDGGSANFGEVLSNQWGQATIRVTVIP